MKFRGVTPDKDEEGSDESDEEEWDAVEEELVTIQE